MREKSNGIMNRREFLGTSAAVGGFIILKPGQVRGTQANSAVRIGLLGCGGRGASVAGGFIENTGSRVTALADLFSDQLEAAQKDLNAKMQAKGFAPVDPSQVFHGPEAYREIAASKQVDAIVLTTPPYFHPMHLDAVVAAGKHVYLEKPVAIDVPGAKRIIEIGKKAEGRLTLAVGFQCRKAPPFVELVRRIHGGALGKVGSGLAYYYCPKIARPDWAGASPEVRRLRNWVWDKQLSGDIIVEQNIHVIDVCNWVLQAHPIKATGAYSRKLRDDHGDCSDNFSAVFTYPGDVQVSFGSTQFGKIGFEASMRFFGTRGSSDAQFGQRMKIWGEEKWDAGLETSGVETQFSAVGVIAGTLDQADPEKQKAFVESIASGHFLNEAAAGAEAALSAMLGRNAAYSGKVLTWDELLKSKQVYDPKINIANMG